MTFALLLLSGLVIQLDNSALSDSKELTELVKADQADRGYFLTGSTPTKAQLTKMEIGDSYRYEETKQILSRAARLNAEGFEAAALLMQHGATPGSFEMAHELSVCASYLKKVNSLPSTAEDRFLKTIKRPQRFGSQYSGTTEPYTLDALDEDAPTAVTDYLRELYIEPHLSQFREGGPLKAFQEAQSQIQETIEHRVDHEWVAKHAVPTVKVRLRRARLNAAGRATVLEIYNRNLLVSDEDFKRAGTILGSSSKPQELLLAHELVTVAFKEGDKDAAMPFMRTWDKFLLSIGRKPRYSAHLEPPSVRAVLGK